LSAPAEGRPHPIGGRVVEGGVNFSVYSEHAAKVELLLFARPDDPSPAEIVPMTHQLSFWHAFVAGAGAGTVYGFRASGPPAPGLRFDRDKVLLDPYARSVALGLWNRQAASEPGDNVRTSLRGVVVDSGTYDWEGDEPLGRLLADTIVYELHVGGFSASPTSAATRPGTFAGLAEKIPHLVQLGVTAVELLPVFQFDETTGDFWGYNPIAHFAPHAAYGTVDEFRDLVKQLHRSGIEVILDVVFNHTGEGDANGPTISFRGLGNDPITAKLIFDASDTG
jgi:isoamylase